MRFSAIIVAAGAGKRAGEGAPKQWRPLRGRPVALWSAQAFQAAGAHAVIAVVPAEDMDYAREVLGPGVRLVPGGAERIDSVRAGLAAVEGGEAVMIHDAARPFLTARHIADLVEALKTAEGALPALPVSDTVKRAGPDRIVLDTADRNGLWRAQTPQAFRLDAIRAAYAAWPVEEVPTDDAAVLERAGGRVALTAGDPMLMKLTYPEDFAMAEALAQAGASARVVRVGQGVDAHRFGPGDGCWLCGVLVPHDQGLVGHSDADAGLHALTDAILGAIGEGDIGDHFPPTDPQWKGAASDKFLLHAAKLAEAKGGRILHADVTLICERPKVKPHRAAMRTRIAELLDLPLDRVSVKATTMEEMGFTGRREGLAAQAVCTVETPA